MTMTSGVGTPFFMAPEMASGNKHYTGAVDVFSFGIMTAQVMVGRLVYDSSDAFETEFGFFFSISLFFTTKPTTLSFYFVFSLVSCLSSKTHSVCECCVPRTSTSCVWLFSQDEITDGCLLGCQPLFSSLFVFLFSLFHLLIFSLLSLFSLFSPHTQQHLVTLLTLSMLSNDSLFQCDLITHIVKPFGVLSLCGLIPSHPMQNTTFSTCSWSTESYAFAQSSIMMTPSVLASIRLLTNTMLFLMSLLGMKVHCEAKHSVVIESLNHHATMWECMLWCALRIVMDCASPMVRGLSFFVMGRTCPCFHDCGIHKCPSLQISTNALTTSRPDLVPELDWEAVSARRLPNTVSSVVIDEEGFQFTDVLMRSLFSFSL